MRQHRYGEPADLYRAQTALMNWIEERGLCNYLHVGDVGHRLFNSCHFLNKTEVFRYWLDETGELVAFAVLCPHWQAFDLQLSPELRCSAEHARLIATCERETLRLARALAIRCDALAVEADSCDDAIRRFIEARGYALEKLLFCQTRHDLEDLPIAELPDGFRFHEATSADAERLADVHNHSFSNKWNAESYRALFKSPHMEHEWVVVAPDGRFAAFVNLWVDEVNRSLLFEPVGAHSDFRRRGLAKALMVHALRRMQAERGIKCAYVGHEPPEKNPASSALYASVGFKPFYEIYEFKKAVPPYT